MKNLIYILVFLFSNICLSQNQSLYEYSWRLEKFVVNGEDITYTDQNNYFHYLFFQNTGEQEALIISNFCYYYYGMYSTINDTQFTYGAAYDDGYCDFNNDADEYMESIGAVFYGQSLLFNYVVNDIGTSKQLIVTNASNDVAIYNSVNLGNQNPDKAKDLVVYPNPTNDKIYFPKSLEYKGYTIYSLEGRLIKTSIILDNSIDLSGLSIGTYILEYELGDKILKKKIVKN